MVSLDNDERPQQHVDSLFRVVRGDAQRYGGDTAAEESCSLSGPGTLQVDAVVDGHPLPSNPGKIAAQACRNECDGATTASAP